MKTFKTLAALIILLAAITNLQAQSDRIRIILHQPPPNMLGVGDMWNLTLENTTKSDLKIYVTGTATEEKDGLIVEGKTKLFTLKPGTTKYTHNDFSGAEVKYNNGRYKEILLRTGNAPEGSYTICVTAFEESGEVAGMENCIMQTVQQMGSITLISPENGAELDPAMPLIFSWTPLPNAKDYKLRIVEIKGDESAETALQNNPEVFSVTSNTAAYTTRGGEHLPWPLKKKKYAWQVSSGDVVSEPYVIRIPMEIPGISLVSPTNGKEIDPDSLSGLVFSWKECPKCPPMYKLRIVEVKGDQSPEVAFRSNQPIMEKDYKSTTTQGDPVHGVDIKPGMKLAWQVTSGDAESEVYVFTVFKMNTGNNDCLFSDNYDNTSNINDPWNEVVSNSTLITSLNDINPCLGKMTTRDLNNHKITVEGGSGSCKFINADEDGVDYRVWKDINASLDNSWQAEFEFSYNVAGLGLENRCGHPIFALTSGTENPINAGSNKMCNFSNQDAIMVWMWQPTALYYNNRGETVPPAIERVVGLTPWCKKGKDLDTYTPRDIFPILPNAFPTYYVRLERLNSTQGRLSVFSDAARTQRIMTSDNKPYICFDIPPDLQNLNILQHSNAPHGSARMLTGVIDNTCIKDINDVILTDCIEQTPNCSGCQIITADVSTFVNSTLNIKTYVGELAGNINPMFNSPEPNFFSDWPVNPTSSPISTIPNTKYIIKASGGFPDQWGRVYDAAYQLSGTWGSTTLPSCQGYAQFMLVNANIFTTGRRPDYPNNKYNPTYHQYIYEFQTPSFPIGDITYTNINNVAGASGNIQASFDFYKLCDTNNYKYEWELIEGNASSVTLSNVNSSSPNFMASVQGQYTYELKITCKSNNQVVDRDTSRIFVYPSADSENDMYSFPTPLTDCGCGGWNPINVSTSSTGPYNAIQHGGIVQVPHGTINLHYISNYTFVPMPPSLTNSLYFWVYKKNIITDESWGLVSHGNINNDPALSNTLSLSSSSVGNHYWVRINPQVPPSPDPEYSCTERNFYVEIVP